MTTIRYFALRIEDGLCWRTTALLASVTALLFTPAAWAEASAVNRFVVDADGRVVPPHVAIDNVCFPILTNFPDGTIGTVVFSQPSHGRLPADVDCWDTADEGLTWIKRGIAAPRDSENSNRMSKAIGVAANGDLVVVSGGWTLIEENNSFGSLNVDRHLVPYVSRSSDAGRTWKVDRHAFPERAPDGQHFNPNGSILRGKNGVLHMTAYTTPERRSIPVKSRRLYVLSSSDDGHTWGDPKEIDPGVNYDETYLWTDGNGWWLAVARHDRLELYESTDDAGSWRHIRAVTEKNGIPGQILRLRDGRLMLMNGNRTPGDECVEVRVSSDRGRTWTAPARVVEFIDFDGGYPSSVQLTDGRVLTAYYARKTAYHDGYHMGTVIWDPIRTFPVNK